MQRLHQHSGDPRIAHGLSISRATGLASVLAVVIFSAAVTSRPAHAQAADTARASWQIVSAPASSQPYTYLNGVVAQSTNDVWSVGEAGNPGLTPMQTLIQHWHDGVWETVPSPNVSTGNNMLSGIASLSTRSIWAVGSWENGCVNSSVACEDTLIEHWDGLQWNVSTSPNVGGSGATDDTLAAVAGSSEHDVWAVGSFVDVSTGIQQTLIEHWNGSKWSIIPSPNVGGTTAYNTLTSVTSIAPDDAWAVGSVATYSSGYTTQQLLEHWDGNTWSVVSGPTSLSSSATSLSSVWAISRDDVWAVGSISLPQGSGWATLVGPSQTLAEHWNGRYWSVSSSPNPGTGVNDALYAVSATRSNDVWAVGSYNPTPLADYAVTLIEHWNGSTWEVAPSPNVTQNFGKDSLVAVACARQSQQVWAVGTHIDLTAGWSQTPLVEYRS